MATSPRTIELQPDAYDLVVREAARRGVEPDAVVDALVRTDLGQGSGEPLAAPDALAGSRAWLPPIDAVALAREGRDELEARGARASSSTRICSTPSPTAPPQSRWRMGLGVVGP